jgi:uncharacterized LabA/DUF88 family protein
MDRYAIFVDAGYFFHQATQILSSKKSYKRSELTLIDEIGLKNMLVSKAEQVLDNNKLLRIYWYDGVKTTLTPMQKQIVQLDDLQLRIGIINGKGEQKGVDSLIVTDLIELATNHAITDALVVTGDSDLAVGISIAQKKGVRIAVMGLHDDAEKVSHNQSFEITSIADKVLKIGCADIDKFISYTPTPTPTPTKPTAAKPVSTATKNPPAKPKATVATPPAKSIPAAPITAQALAQAVDTFVTNTPGLSKNLLDTTDKIEHSMDSKFLYELCIILKVSRLDSTQKVAARELLRTKLKAMK